MHAITKIMRLEYGTDVVSTVAKTGAQTPLKYK